MPDTGPVTELREAARLMRERAQAAHPGPWEILEERGPFGNVAHLCVMQPFSAHFPGARSGLTSYVPLGTQDAETARHIASWSPPVALAVADWLDAETAEAEHYLAPPRHPFDWDCGRCGSDLSNGCTCWGAALAVARAYLGRTDDQPA